MATPAPKATPTAAQAQVRAKAPTASDMELLGAQLLELKAQNDQQQAQIMELKAHCTRKAPTAKVSAPAPYDGWLGTLGGFITQLKAYRRYNEADFEDDERKVLHAANLLKGDANSWFEATLRDYLDNKAKHQDDGTLKVFGSIDKFVRSLQKTFGDPDEERAAERKLQRLKQTGSAAEYASEFRQVTSRLAWDNEPLMVMFYHRLKDEVKVDLTREKRPDDFTDYVEMAVAIDNRCMRGSSSREELPSGKGWKAKPYYKANTMKSVHPRGTSWGTHSGPMELDATTRKDFNDKCLNCGKEGHFARDCKQPKKFNKVPEGRQGIVATRNDER